MIWRNSAHLNKRAIKNYLIIESLSLSLTGVRKLNKSKDIRYALLID